MIILTAEEKRKFIDWLCQQAESDRLMMKQSQNISAGAGLTNMLKTRMSAYLIVAKDLTDVEEMTLR